MHIEIRSGTVTVRQRRILGPVTFAARAGELVCVLGPNGSGKTTMLNVLSRFINLTSGALLIDGDDCSTVPASHVAGRGVARLLQRRSLVPSLSLLDNVRLGAPSPRFTHLLTPASAPTHTARARACLDWVGLTDPADHGMPAEHAPVLAQRFTELARARMGLPRMLLLDEPLASLGTDDQASFLDVLSRCHSEGLGVVVVEHKADALTARADRVVRVDDGVLSGA